MMMIEDFKREVEDWSDVVGLKPKEIQVRKMSRKWASCSSRGRVSFSFELLEKEFEDRAKVIVHELLHLRYPSHNGMFDNLLKAHLEKGINKNK